MFNRPEWPPMERTSSRAEALASRLQEVASELVAVIERIDERAWWHTPGPSVWSISKDADHVADAAAYHQWIVRLTIGEKVSSRRPSMERSQMTSERSPAELAALIRERTDDGVRLVRGLTDEQLDLPTRPPRVTSSASSNSKLVSQPPRPPSCVAPSAISATCGNIGRS